LKLVNGSVCHRLDVRVKRLLLPLLLLLALKPFHRCRRRLLHGVVVGNRSMPHKTAPAGTPLATLSRDRYFRFRFRLVDNVFTARKSVTAVSFALEAILTIL